LDAIVLNAALRAYTEHVGSETPNALPVGKPSDSIRDGAIRFAHALTVV
jgi:hypothetical protein